MPVRVESRSLDGPGREGGHVVEMQRRRLLLAFSEIAVEDGLESTGVGRVCKRAGVSRRTFYELFDGREGCFMAVVDAAIERLAGRVSGVWRGEENAVDGLTKGSAAGTTTGARWDERVRAVLTVLLECFDEEPALARVCLVETLKGGPAVLRLRQRALDVLVAAVDEGRSDAKDGSGPSALTAQGVVGGAISVLHTRALTSDPTPLVELVSPLTSMVVLPYLGAAAARRESDRPTPKPAYAGNGHPPRRRQDPFKDLPIRITFRTARVLTTIDAFPGASNRQIGDAAGVPDQGQISKLLRRLQGHGLVENSGQGHTKGERNAWRLTERGSAIQHAIETPAA